MVKQILFRIEKPGYKDFQLPAGMPLNEAREFAKDYFAGETDITLVATVYEPVLEYKYKLQNY